MKGIKWAGIILFCMLAFSLSAQKKKKAQAPNSIDPSAPSEVYSPKASRKKKSKTTHNARDNFYDRVELLEKKRRKNERNADQPQYTNFQYFGHKKPPKRRPPEKMKYCKICGIRH